MRRLLYVLIALVAAGALVWVALRTEPVAVETARVDRGSLAETLREEGFARARERFVVAAPLDGHLHRVALEPGDEVIAGETLLALIDPLAPALLDARAVTLAEARVASAEAAIAVARERESSARVLHAAAEADLERRVRGGDAVSAQSLADARREVAFHAGEVSTAEAASAVAAADLAVARAALDATRPEPGELVNGHARAGGLRLVAPIDGRVLAVLRESAGPVRIGEALLELADLAELEIVADYLTADAVRMRAGMEARAVGWASGALPSTGLDGDAAREGDARGGGGADREGDARGDVDARGDGDADGGRALEARVRRVEPRARTKVSALGVEEQRVDVVLDLVGGERAIPSLGDGFRVQVEVVVARAADVVRVPEAALVRSGGAWSVFALAGERVELVPVELGLRDGRFAEVRAGLAPGAEVVVYPGEGVVAGAKVRRRDARAR